MSEFNKNLFERGQDIICLFHEQDGNTDITGDWLKMRDYQRIGILLIKAGTEDVDDIGLQLLQGKTSSGGSSKALSIPVGAPLYYKTGVITSQLTWTKVEVTAAIDGAAFGSSVPTGFTRVVADVNTDALQLYTEIKAEDLDADNSFNWLTAFIEGDNVNNTVLLSCYAILMGGRFPQSTPLSCIA